MFSGFVKAVDPLGSMYKFEDYFIDDRLDAMTVLPFLLNRTKPSENELLEQINLLRSNNQNKFSSNTGWIHNNLFNCILYIFNHPCHS